MLRQKEKKIGFGVSMDENLLKYLDKRSKKYKVNRSAYLSHLVEEDKLKIENED